MEVLKQRIISNKEKNINNLEKKNEITVIKSKNSCYFFKISFNISTIKTIPEEFRPKFLFEFSKNEEELMIIKADLLNKDKFYFNEKNEEMEVSEVFYEIYSLAELKNNIEGCEWFNELYEFKKAFLKGINNNKCELLIIKNVLLFNINIINIFGNNLNCYLILRPYSNKIDNKINSDSNGKDKLNENEHKAIELISSKYKKRKANSNLLRINTFIEPKDMSFNKENFELNKEFLEKKRIKLRKNRNKHLICDSKKDNNQLIEKQKLFKNNNENKNNLSDMINRILEEINKRGSFTLPEFEIDGLLKESHIVKDIEEELLIGDMITILKTKKYRLLFRASRDGDSANKFHSICDNSNNLIILVQTNKGLRFGGYTSNKFKVSSHMKYDNNAFLFSLDLKKVYKIAPGEYAIYCYYNSGPCFSQGSLYIPNNFFKKFGKTSLAGGPYQFKEDYEINKGQEKFLVKELEIFQVQIEL
jgi:hypothetical protein